uniref:C2H2-type domain-containing protein n=1 Tax=Sphaeramia orbicularis TaxID=375764 RepID=A0A672YHN4_9TELE
RNRRSCGPARKLISPSSHPLLSLHLQTKTDEQNEDSEETEDSDEDQTLNHKHDKNLLEEHMDTHTGQKLKNTTQETNSPRDMMKSNDLTPSDVGYEKKLYLCPVCSKPFCWKSRLHRHMMSHTGEKPFTCPLCHKCFRDRSIVRRHMRVHTGERPFYCSVCGKSFTYNSHLTAHLRVHTGEKPFSCSECGKTFGQQIGLERHMMLHSGEKPFSCVVCQKRFKRKHHVQTHMKIHTKFYIRTTVFLVTSKCLFFFLSLHLTLPYPLHFAFFSENWEYFYIQCTADVVVHKTQSKLKCYFIKAGKTEENLTFFLQNMSSTELKPRVSIHCH